MTQRFVEAHGLSEAWMKAANAVYSESDREITHLTVRIEDPGLEDFEIRATVDVLLRNLRLQSVDSVRNTIFPLEWSKDLPEPSALVADYRLHYPVLKALAGSNRGTYFGRIVAYPGAKGEIDQLGPTIQKLHKSNSPPNPRRTSIYEVSIYNALSDGKIDRGFPCMSHLAFHLEGTHVHMCAQYRNQDLVERAYGNYLGLSQLQKYVAESAGLQTGALTLFVGHAFVPSGTRQALAGALKSFDSN
jgi:thymidylate synthase